MMSTIDRWRKNYSTWIPNPTSKRDTYKILNSSLIPLIEGCNVFITSTPNRFQTNKLYSRTCIHVSTIIRRQIKDINTNNGPKNIQDYYTLLGHRLVYYL